MFQELCLQERFTKEVVLSFLGDEDGRVRRCAATTLVRYVGCVSYTVAQKKKTVCFRL